ncbi:MAG TPA: magnesium/cobalt transporter CorA [Chloroflexota bacterium]|nr:magnesium/cobalt transporter CorA [Chloroflexota bacterium]
MIHTRIYAADGRHLIDVPLADVARLRQDPGTMIWVDLQSALPEELTAVAGIFGLMSLTVEDLSTQGQRAKLEPFDGYDVLIMHGMLFDSDTLKVDTPELDIVIGPSFLITNHQDLAAIRKHPSGPEHDCAGLAKGPTLILYRVVDRLVDSYYPVLEQIDETIDQVEERVLTSTSTQVLQEIFTLKHSLSYLRKVISPQLEMFNRLIAREDRYVAPEFTPYFRDVYDHLVRTFEVVDSYRDLMSSAMDAYLSMVSNRQNEIMKRLTLFTTIFLPITFLTGLFGQNFGHMPQVEHDNGYFWWIALACMGLITLGQILYYRSRGWL